MRNTKRSYVNKTKDLHNGSHPLFLIHQDSVDDTESDWTSFLPCATVRASVGDTSQDVFQRQLALSTAFVLYSPLAFVL